MSDLHCPARILLVRNAALVGHIRTRERVAATYDGAVELSELADRHRGEAVVVVGEHDHGAADVVLVEIDADGLRARPWDAPGH